MRPRENGPGPVQGRARPAARRRRCGLRGRVGRWMGRAARQALGGVGGRVYGRLFGG